MEDFKIIISKLMELLSIEIPVFGFRFSCVSIIIGTFILGLVIRVIVGIFGGDD